MEGLLSTGPTPSSFSLNQKNLAPVIPQKDQYLPRVRREKPTHTDWLFRAAGLICPSSPPKAPSLAPALGLQFHHCLCYHRESLAASSALPQRKPGLAASSALSSTQQYFWNGRRKFQTSLNRKKKRTLRPSHLNLKDTFFYIYISTQKKSS